MELFAGTVPANKTLFARTIPENTTLFAETVPANNTANIEVCTQGGVANYFCFFLYCMARQHPVQNASTQRHGQPALMDN